MPDVTRIVAHADFDGLISALLMQEVLGVEEVAFAESWEISEGRFMAHRSDAVIGLPYPVEGCALWVDHHATNAGPAGPHISFDPDSKSCASLIMSSWPGRVRQYAPLVHAAEKVSGADYSEQDIRAPGPAMQVAISLEHGSDRYREFIIEQLRTRSLEDVAAMAPVQARYAAAMREHDEFLQRCGQRISIRGAVLVLDAGMRAPRSLLQPMLFLRHPNAAVSIVISDAERGRARVMVSENIFLRVNTVDLGSLMKRYGGGGHRAVAGCSIPLAQKDEIVERLIVELNQ